MFDNKTGRKYVENTLNNAVENIKPIDKRREITISFMDKQFEDLPEAKDISNVWDKMTKLRNDIAHVGMNLHPKKAVQLKKDAVSLYGELQKLAEKLLSN